MAYSISISTFIIILIPATLQCDVQLCTYIVNVVDFHYFNEIMQPCMKLLLIFATVCMLVLFQFPFAIIVLVPVF